MYKLVNSNPPQSGYTSSWTEFYTVLETDSLLAAKQDVLTAGTGIDITGSVISTVLTDLLDDTTASTTTTYSSSKIEDLLTHIIVDPYTVSDPLRMVNRNIMWPDVTTPGGTWGGETQIPVLTLTTYGLVSGISAVTVYPPTSPGTAGQYFVSRGTGAGTWQAPATTVEASQSLITAYAVKQALDALVLPTYTAGANVTISATNVISSNQIDDSAASVNKTYSSDKLNTLLGTKQDVLTAGSGIVISGNEISANQVDDSVVAADRAYSSQRTQQLLDLKQSVLTAGTNVTISGTTVSSDQLDDTTARADKAYSSQKTQGLIDAVNAAVSTKQDVLSASSPLSLLNTTIYMEDSGVTPGQYGRLSYGDATLVPVVSVDRFGRVVDMSTMSIYPPIDAGETGQYWRSDGSGRGSWRSPAGTLTHSDTEIPSSAAVMDYISSGDRTMLVFRGYASSAADLPASPTVGSFWIASADFEYTLPEGDTQVNAGDWLVYNYDEENPDGYRWYVWPLGQGSVTSVNGQSGVVVLTGADLASSSSDSRTVAAVLESLEDDVGDLSTLTTASDASLVAAVNELNDKKQVSLTASSPLKITPDATDPTLKPATLEAEFDSAPTEDSGKFLTSGAVYTETYADVKAVDADDNEINGTKLKHLTKAQYDALADAGELDGKTYYNVTDDAGTATPSMLTMFQSLYSVSPASWDTTPTSGSTNPVTSAGIYSALQEVRDASIQILSELPAEGEKGTIYYVYDSETQGYSTFVWDTGTESFEQVGSAALSLTMDAAPTAGSANAVTSAGIYAFTSNSVRAQDKDGRGVLNSKIVSLTGAEYEALEVKDENTYYFVED